MTTITQTRCLKCKNPLETLDARNLGLGADCAANIKRAFEADKAANGEATISALSLFNLLTVFGNDNNIPAAQEVALGLLNSNTFADVTWAIMEGCYILIRTHREHRNEEAVTLILAALKDICPRMTAMSLGEASPAAGLLDYDPESKNVMGMLTTVRQGSSELAKIPGVKRAPENTRMWSFPLRGACAVKAIASVRYPFVTLTPAFEAACVECAALPALPPPPVAFSGYLATELMVVTYRQKDEAGKYLLSYGEGDALSGWLKDTIGASWYRPVYQQTGQPAWLIPADRYQEVMDRLAVVFAPKAPAKTTAPRASAPRRSYR